MARPNQRIKQKIVNQNFAVNNMRSFPQGSDQVRGLQPNYLGSVINPNIHQNNVSAHTIEMSNRPSSVILPPQYGNINRPKAPILITSQTEPNINSRQNHSSQQATMYKPQIIITPGINGYAQSQPYFPGYAAPILISQSTNPFQRSHAQMIPYCVPATLQPQFCNNSLPLQATHPKQNISPPTVPVQNNNGANNTYKKLKTRPNALTNIIDPATGRNIAAEIYQDAATSPPIKNEQPSYHRIPNQNLTRLNKPQKPFPKLSITISPSSTLSTTMTSSHSESLSPVPLSTSSRLSSPNKYSTDINNPPEDAIPTNEGVNNVKTSENSDCIESLEVNSKSLNNNDHPLPRVLEEYCSQLDAGGANNEQSCHKEIKSENILGKPSKNTNGKSQKKKNKRKSKNRDLNRNQIQSSSTSSEESTLNSQVEPSTQDVEEIKPSVIPDINEEKKEEPVVERIESIDCNQKKCDIIIEAPFFEKTEKDSVKEDFSIQETIESTNSIDLKKELIEIPGDSCSFEITSNCVINNGTDQCYIRGANGINFFFSDMSEVTADLNWNQDQEKQINHHNTQNLLRNDEEQRDIFTEKEQQQENNEIKVETQEASEVEPIQQNDTGIESEQAINNEIDLEHQKDNAIELDQFNCRELEADNLIIQETKVTPELDNESNEEHQSNVEISEKKQPNNNDKPPESVEIKEKSPTYENDEESSNNIPARRIYSPEFLMNMKDNKECWIRPNLPDVDIVKHNMKRPSRNSSAILSSRDKNHEFLFPSFSKFSSNTKAASTNRRSFQEKSKPHKQAIIHVSLSLNKDIKLRQTENAWKPRLLEKEKLQENNSVDAVLFKKMRSILNKLTPEKFDTLVGQVKQLEVNSFVQLKGIIDILFQKAIDEPLYSTYYALMCKELSDKSIPNDEKASKIDFNFLVIASCQEEFEKNFTDDNELNEKAQIMDHIKDSNENKKELELEEKRNKSKRRSLGNIKFVGELFKHGIINKKTIIKCIENLLKNHDEDRLESLCKLLITTGQLLEQKMSLSPYFDSLKKLIDKNRKQKLSSRIRFMIQDVIELRISNWVPRMKENNPQTIGQIQKEVETERINNDTPLRVLSHKEFITPRKDERDGYINRRGSYSRSSSNIDENGWSNVRSNRNRPPTTFSFISAKLNIKTPAAEETTFGSKSLFMFNQPAENKQIVVDSNRYASLNNIMKNRRSSIASSDPPKEFRPEFKPYCLAPTPVRDNFWTQPPSLPISRTPTPPKLSSHTFIPISRTPTPPISSSTLVDNGNNNLPIDENKLRNLVKSLLDESSSSDVNLFIKNAQETIEDKFNPQSYPLLIEEALNSVLERNQMERRRFSSLLAQLIKDQIIPLSVFQAEFEKLLEIADDLVIDIPQCWKYFAEILMAMVIVDAHPFVELTRTLAILRCTGNCSKLLGELLSLLAKEKTAKWVADNWNQSGLEWTDLINSEGEKIDDVLKTYNLEFLVKGINNNDGKLSENQMTLEQVSEYLLKLLKENNFDNTTNWISSNVGEKSQQPQFIRCLVTTILKTSIESINDSWRLKPETFFQLLPLITRYVDAKRDLELQCLYAIQSFNHELLYPQGVLSKIIDVLCDQSVLSDDAFMEWEKTEDPSERNGHGVAIKTLTSFFTKLRETERDDSSE